MYRILLCIAVLGASASWGAEQIVWQIGSPDRDYAEFACAGNYQQSAAHFPGPIVFEVRRSEPARNWPFIQPGPADAWAPQRGKPWTIGFHLAGEPRGVFTLRIEFVDVHGQFPPRYSVGIGERKAQFQLEAGGGDASLVNAKAGKPQKIELPLPASFFRKGRNAIELACVDGSWVQYDVPLFGSVVHRRAGAVLQYPHAL